MSVNEIMLLISSISSLLISLGAIGALLSIKYTNKKLQAEGEKTSKEGDKIEKEGNKVVSDSQIDVFKAQIDAANQLSLSFSKRLETLTNQLEARDRLDQERDVKETEKDMAILRLTAENALLKRNIFILNRLTRKLIDIYTRNFASKSDTLIDTKSLYEQIKEIEKELEDLSEGDEK